MFQATDLVLTTRVANQQLVEVIQETEYPKSIKAISEEILLLLALLYSIDFTRKKIRTEANQEIMK